MKETSELSFTVLALSLIKGVGATFVKKNLVTIKQSCRYGSATSADEIITQILAIVGKKYSSSEIKEAVSKAENIVSECELHKISFTSVVDANYPKKLFELKDPPPILFFLGNFSLLYKDAITIIGTRKPNKTGNIIAERIGKYFSSRGWVICNGLADGIDTFSIRDQEEYCFAEVVGVVGSGLAKSSFRSLPKQSVANIEYILANDGLVISEMPPLKKQDTFSVVKSCRIQAGLGAGLILIQSSIKGGSRFTVKAAVESNRPLGVIYPVKTDMERDDYGANRKIIEEGVQGLNEFVDLKNGKSSNPKIVVLSSKESYPAFESALKTSNPVLSLNI
ncbi:DNA-processing protein DprA [Cylindrospermum sp. FACHB-282]|uniref:DNA-processing protein DprA n=1 Tax=Cylindrospermum sp. FACHB-282 TaxID=2692794 RepID=UPI001682A590|nr:DNA-processing protein DprA [Cylindrospermum sp. FACHB-282]MBD2384322.1 DNA-processing protein DprA [Cylindrospermum sp. FACHB-282]